MTRPSLVVLVAVAAALGLLLGPALGTLDQRFLGVEYTDHYGTQWFYGHAEQVLREGVSPGWTDLQFFPFGKDLYRHTGANLVDAAAAVPLRLLLGPVLGYNVFVVLGMVLTGLSFRRLAGLFTTDRVALGVGAVLFACSPYLLYELREGRPTQALLITLPLVLRQAWLTGERSGWSHPVIGGLWLAATGLTYWFYAFFAGLAVLGLGLLRILQAPQPGTVLARYVLFAAVGVAGCLPAALPLALESLSGGSQVPGLLDPGAWSWSQLTPITTQGEAIGLFSWQPLTGHTGLFTLDEGQARFLACHRLISPAALLIGVLWLRRPGALDRRSWAVLVLPAALFAAGPLLIVGQGFVINPWWAAWTAAVPLLRRLWWPSRASVILALGIGLCAVVVLAWLGRRGPRFQALGALALGGLWAHHLQAQDLAPFPSWSAEVPAGYRCLADGDEGALIELPYAWTQGHLYYQTVHGRPMLGGMLEDNPHFTPAAAAALRQDNSFLAALLALSDLQGQVPGWTVADREALGTLGFGWVVFQKDAYVDPDTPGHDKGATARRTHLRRTTQALITLLGPPVYDDARIALYAPWGAALPCDPSTLPPDTAPGVGEVLRHTILSLPQEQAVVHPLLAR